MYNIDSNKNTRLKTILRRVKITRGTTQIAANKPPLLGSNNPYALTQQSREKSTFTKISVLRLGRDRHLQKSTVGSHHTPTL